MSGYTPDMVLREARLRHFATNGLGPDGGYNDEWGTFVVGKLVIPFPNSPSRVKVLSYHDVHHIVTGYDTSTLGELEISSWEIGAGCKDYLVSWHFDLMGLAAGLLFIPRRAFRAFVRGRRTRTLFGQDVEALYDRTVGEVAGELGLDRPAYEARASDMALFVPTALVGLVIMAVTFVLLVALGPLLYLYLRVRRGAAPKPSARTYRTTSAAPVDTTGS